MSKKQISLSFTKDQWTEIAEACWSKALFIRHGEFGPEEKRGDDKRWIADIEAIAREVEEKAEL